MIVQRASWSSNRSEMKGDGDMFEHSEQTQSPGADNGAALFWLAGGALLALSLIGSGLWALWLSRATPTMVSDLTWFFLCH